MKLLYYNKIQIKNFLPTSFEYEINAHYSTY